MESGSCPKTCRASSRNACAIWRKLDCLHPSPQRWNRTLFGTTSLTRCHRHAWNRVSSRLRSGRWAMRSERMQGDERDAYVVRARSSMTHHGMAYGARALGSRSRRSSAPCHQRIGVSDTRPGLKEHLVPTTVRRASNGLQTWKQDAEQSICGARADKPKPTRQRRSG